MILVSACLLGNPVRFDGKSKPFELLLKYKDSPQIQTICPETFGKLPIPRPPAEIKSGTGNDVWENNAIVVNKEGLDVTDNFKNGALFCRKFLEKNNVTAIILKERSPSCGVHYIYDGTFSGRTIPGQGVATAFFKQFNIPLYSEEDLTEELLQQLLQADLQK